MRPLPRPSSERSELVAEDVLSSVMLTPETLAILQAHVWVLILSLIVSGAIRSLKPDVPIPVNVPKEWRAPLAIAIGLVGGLAVYAFGIVANMTLLRAIVGGLIAGGMAIVGHETLVESALGRKPSKPE